ncbi:MAG: CopG family antitoxin [Caldilineaceae bacterium]|nr:CopG family antitoxin [Caldilineaceae bacterium]MDE0631535.1 CopG family antitoxin [Caldilineaceae bacterium]
MNGNRILQTDSIQELADFWDTHDLTDFDAELEEVDEPVFDRQTTVTVRLEPEESRIVRALARLHGVSHAQLITQWVVERLQSSSRSVT